MKLPTWSTARFRTPTLAILLALFASMAHAQALKIELYPLQTMTLSSLAFLTGVKDGKATAIAAELRIPGPGTERLPAVVLLAGGNGGMANIDRWSHDLNAIGVATFIVDNFSGRGSGSAPASEGELSLIGTTYDAYRALDFLANHSGIDPARIAVMGFSFGGFAALYSSLNRFRRMHGSAGTAFAAHIAFYPPCGARFIDDGDVSGKPIRVFHGAADDLVPAAACRAYVQRLRAAGADAEITEYPDAYHAFDVPSLATPTRLAQLSNATRCRWEERSAGRIVNSETGQPPSANDACMQQGATVGYNAAAHRESIAAVKQFLIATFKIQSPVWASSPGSARNRR